MAERIYPHYPTEVLQTACGYLRLSACHDVCKRLQVSDVDQLCAEVFVGALVFEMLDGLEVLHPRMERAWEGALAVSVHGPLRSVD